MGVLLAVSGGKDGVGKTTFALHLAYGLYRNAGSPKVCLIEADVGALGDLQTMLNFKQAKTFVDFVKGVGRMDPKLAQNWAGKHPTGLSILAGANFVSDFQNLDDQNVDKAIKLLKRAFDYVLIDVGREINPLSFRVFENSDMIFMVTDADILAVNQTGELLKRMRSLHFGNDQFKVVVNRYDPRGVVNPTVLKQKFNLDAKILLAKDPGGLQQVISAAKPLQMLNSKHPYLKGIDEAIRMVSQLKAAESKSRIGKSQPGQPLDVLSSVLPFTYGEAQGGMKAAPRGTTPDTIMERNLAIRARVHQRLLELVDMREMDAMSLEKDPKKKEELRSKVVQAVHQLLEEEAKEAQDRKERAGLAKDVIDEALGLGPIEPLLNSSDVTEIMVNGKDMIYVEQNGKITLSDYRFTSDKQLLGCIERILMPIGRRVDEKTPLADGRLPDGSRINVVIPPLALSGPTLTIRKFFKEKLTVKDLVKFGSFTEEMGDFFRAAVEAHLNIIVAGGTGTGKTTLLNLVAGFIPSDERIVTVEDAAELQLPQEHVITLETKPPNLQGEGAIVIRDLVRNALRMRPDRIVVGECRGGEALDMLQAMNTGHDGSLTTVHANNPRDTLRRLETLVMMAGFDLPVNAIREQIASAVNLIIQLKRFSDGSRRVSHVTEVIGLEGDTLVTQPIFEFKQTGTDEKGKVQGVFQPSGLIPKFVETLKAKGIALPKGLFGGKGASAPSSSASSEAKSEKVSGPAASSSQPGASGSRPGAPGQRPASPQPGSSQRPGSSGRPQSPKRKIPVRNPHGVKKR